MAWPSVAPHSANSTSDYTAEYSAWDAVTSLNDTASNGTKECVGICRLLYPVITPVLYGLISLTGIIGNSLVIYVIASKRSMRTETNMLLLNLAIADVSFVIIVPPFTAYQQATSGWPFGLVACKLLHYLVNVTAYVTVYTLVLVSVIRYMTIVHNVRTASIRTARNVGLAVGAIWVVMLTVNVPILMSYGIVNGDCLDYGIEVGRRVFATFFVFAYVLPLTVIAVFSVAILRHITGHRLTPSMIQQHMTTKKSRSEDRKRQVSRLLILVVVIFAILWLPVHIHLLLAFFSYVPDNEAYEAASVLWTALAYFNSCVNPIIYNRTSRDFRDAFREAVCCRKSESELEDDRRRTVRRTQLTSCSSYKHCTTNTCSDVI